MVFFIRIFVAQGWYIGTASLLFPRSSQPIKLTIPSVAYSLGIYLLNLFLAFLQPKFDPSNEAIDNEMEDGSAGGLPTKQDEEFRPFIRRLPEFKFWYSATRAITIGFVCTWFSIFDVPVFWPVLVVYWLILFALTSKSCVRKAGAIVKRKAN
jgi:Rer1 family